MSVNFMVTCHGWSGSNWLANALHTHPDIICTHSVANLLPHGSGYNAKQEDECSRQGYTRGRKDQTLAEHFTGLRELGEAKAYGSVHRYRLRDLPNLLQNAGGVSFQLVNLVRHPVNLAASGQGQFEDLVQREIFARIEVMDFCKQGMKVYEALAKRHQIDICDWSFLSFLAACQHCYVLVHDLKALRHIAPIPNIMMEKMTSERDYFKQHLAELTQNTLDISEDYLDEVFQIGRINQHRKKAKLTAEQQFNEWAPWQREGFAIFAAQSGIIQEYSAIGYDFSFITGA